MTHRVGVFYLSRTPGPDRQALDLPGGGVAYVRVEETTLTDLAEALDAATPQRGEWVMNSHELEDL